MSGICGIINFNREPVQESDIRNMMQIMKHRGSDDEAIFLEKNLGLGLVLLRLIDFNTANHNQLMQSQDKRYVIVFDGMIFNYFELRKELESLGNSFISGSYIEVLLSAYIQWSEDFLHKLNGMWSFVIFDRINKSVFASRDRYGIKPFYYCIIKESFIFASEIPPILSVLKQKPRLDNLSIFDFLAFNRTDQNERTFYQDIKKLQHGHNLIFNIKSSDFKVQLSIRKWYDLRERVKMSESFKDPSEFRELLSSAIGLRIQKEVPYGVCLSGGLDSSSIVSILLKHYNKNDLKTFSAIYEKGQLGDESVFIEEFQSILKNIFYIKPNTHTLISDLEDFIKTHAEPLPSTSPYAQYKVMELANKHVAVTLDGQGADELFAGYQYFFGFYFKDLFRNGKLLELSSEIFHYLKEHKSIYGLKTFAFFMLPSSLRTRVKTNEKRYINHEFINKYSCYSDISDKLYGSKTLEDALFNHFEYKLEHLLKWEDRNSMRFSIEARVPFLDYRFVEKSLSLDNKDVINKGMTKSIFREAMRNIVPENIRLRKDKIGFGTPEAEWFRDPLFKNLITELLTTKSFSDEYINKKTALRLYNDHFNKRINISREIWKWINLELWYRHFLS